MLRCGTNTFDTRYMDYRCFSLTTCIVREIKMIFKTIEISFYSVKSQKTNLVSLSETMQCTNIENHSKNYSVVYLKQYFHVLTMAKERLRVLE